MSRQGTTDYTLLLSALPALRPLFSAKITPISRLQLDKRLQMLSEEDGALLAEIENLLQWDHLSLRRKDEELVAMAIELTPKLKHPDLQEAVFWRLDMRALVAALRFRLRGGDPGQHGAFWSYGRFVDNIRRHWHHPQFQLQHRFPWLLAVEQALAAEDPLTVEKILLQAAWRHMSRIAERHGFDFVGVVLYVLRWNIVERWLSYDQQRGLSHFQQLTDNALGEYRQLFPETTVS